MNLKDDEFFKKLLSTFKVESKERIQNMSTSLLELEKAQDPARQASLIEIIYREIHSLKSAARSVDLQHIEKVCNSMENIFSTLKKDKIIPTPQQLDVLHKTCDSVDQLIDFEDTETTKLDKKSQEILSLLESIQYKTSELDDGLSKENFSGINTIKKSKMEETVRIPTLKLDTLLVQAEEMLTTKLNLMQRITDFSELRNEFRASSKEWDKLTQEKLLLKKHIQKTTEDSEAIVSAQEKILAFLNCTETKFKTFSHDLDSLSNALDHDFHIFSNGVDTLLEDTKKLLMWPFSTLLNTFPRIVRELARNQRKDVNFVLQGGDVEIDKRILEELKDVLLHIIRNAIDHGIESTDVRKKLNKAEQGYLKVSVQQLSGNEILIEITDDGSGVNLEKVKAVAIKERIITSEEAKKLSDEDALNLIYHSGISTSAILTDLSGRGLGMTIVREKIDKVTGKLSVVSKMNEGTTIKIQLPLTLATFKGVLVGVSDQLFVIPTANLERILRININDIKSVENKDAILYGGQTTSLVWVSDILGLSRTNNKNNAEAFFSVMIIAYADTKVAFVVDNILNEQEILVKNFSKPISNVRNISAAAILGTGKTVPILNSIDLLQSAHSSSSRYKESPVDIENKPNDIIHILLVEDSITTRMLLKNILELKGYQVSTAVDGLDAWTQLKESEFSVVVSDVEMPRMTGFELTEKIRQDKRLENVPVILVTARESQEDRERGVEAGANAYINKSTFDSSHLLEVVQRFSG